MTSPKFPICIIADKKESEEVIQDVLRFLRTLEDFGLKYDHKYHDDIQTRLKYVVANYSCHVFIGYKARQDRGVFEFQGQGNLWGIWDNDSIIEHSVTWFTFTTLLEAFEYLVKHHLTNELTCLANQIKGVIKLKDAALLDKSYRNARPNN